MKKMFNSMRLLSLLLLSATNLVLGQLENPSIIYPSGENEHSITWSVEEGEDYRLESSTDLKTWTSGPPFKTDSQHFAIDIPRTAGKQIFFRLAEADISGPKVVSAYPADGGFGINPRLPMIFEFFDRTAVDMSTFRITVSSSVYSATFDVSHVDVSADEIEIPLYGMAGFHPNNAWAGANEEVTVSISIRDTLGNETAETYTFTTQGVTTLAPETFNFGGVEAQNLGLYVDSEEAIFMRINDAEVVDQEVGSWYIADVVPNFVYIYGTSIADLENLRAELIKKTKMISSCTVLLNNQFSRTIDRVSEVIPFPDSTDEFYLEIEGSDIELEEAFSSISLSTNPWTLPLSVTEYESSNVYGEPTKYYYIDSRQHFELFREFYGEDAINYLISGTTPRRARWSWISPFSAVASVGKVFYEVAKDVTTTVVKATVAAAVQVGEVVKKAVEEATTIKRSGERNERFTTINFKNANVTFQKNIGTGGVAGSIRVEAGLRPTSYLEGGIGTSYMIDASLIGGQRKVKASLTPRVKAECDIYAKGTLEGTFELEQTLIPALPIATVPIGGPVPVTVSVWVGADFGVDASGELTAEVTKGIVYDKEMGFTYDYDNYRTERKHRFERVEGGKGLQEKPLTLDINADGFLKCSVKPYFKAGLGVPLFSAGFQATFEPYVLLNGEASVKASSNSPLMVSGLLALSAGVDFDLDAYYEAGVVNDEIDLFEFNVFEYELARFEADWNASADNDQFLVDSELSLGKNFSLTASHPSNLAASYQWFFWDKDNIRRRATQKERTYRGVAKFQNRTTPGSEKYEVVITPSPTGPNAGKIKRQNFTIFKD